MIQWRDARRRRTRSDKRSVQASKPLAARPSEGGELRSRRQAQPLESVFEVAEDESPAAAPLPASPLTVGAPLLFVEPAPPPLLEPGLPLAELEAPPALPPAESPPAWPPSAGAPATFNDPPEADVPALPGAPPAVLLTPAAPALLPPVPPLPARPAATSSRITVP